MRDRTSLLATSAFVLSLLFAAPAAAQDRPSPILEAAGGYAGFIDESMINHAIAGASARAYVTRRIAIGPEVTFMRGPGVDRDWFLTGNATIDLRTDRDRRPRVVPYIVASAGVFWNTNAVGTGLYTARSGAVAGGIGARINAGNRWFIAPEVRIGFEPVLRLGVAIGIR